MALTSNKRIEFYGAPSQRMKKFKPAAAGTFYIGEIVGIEPSVGLARPMSGSGEAGYQCLGIVTREQTIAAAGDKLEFETGPVWLSGSGCTADEDLKIIYASDSSGMFDAHSAGRHAVGRLVLFSTTAGSSAGNNIVVNIGTVRSGTTV
jgi:hypothetical protein